MELHLANHLHHISEALYGYLTLILSAMALFLFFDPLIWRPLGKAHSNKVNARDEIPLLGTQRKGEKIKGTCIVAGGSLSGLMTARAMTDHFEKVIIVEPDTVGRTPRSHQPVGTDIVIKVMERLFPDTFHGERLKSGIFFSDASNFSFLVGDRRFASVGKTPYQVICCTRMGFERLLRNLVQRFQPPVQTINGSVVGVIPSTESKHISAVIIKENERETYSLPVSLLVDCTGPASCGTKWLEQPNDYLVKNGLGHRLLWKAPKRSQYKLDANYVTALIKIPEEHMESLPRPPHSEKASWKEQELVFATLPALAKDDRFVMMLHSEQMVFTVSAGGKAEHRLEVKNMEEFRNMAKTLEKEVSGGPLPEWLEWFLDAFVKLEKEGKINVDFKPHRKALCYFNHYHELMELPADFVAVGDAVADSNPRYGQGIGRLIKDITTLNAVMHTVTVLGEAKDDPELAEVHKQQRLPVDFSKRYFAKVYERSWPNWEFCRAEDYGSSSTKILDEGDSLSTGKMVRLYNFALYRLAARDKKIADIVYRFLCGDVDTTSVQLFHPFLVVRVLLELAKVGIQG